MSSAPDERQRLFEARRLSFGAEADLYERARPSYPPEAAGWMLGENPLRVVDLGAGTGKFTRVVAALGHQVIAVEPDPGMRARLAERSPGVAVLAGSAEAIPLEDGSVDAVVAAQSFHWFDSAEARAEIARVLRPGGVFAPIWNVRDDSVPWVAELGRRVLEGDRERGRPCGSHRLRPALRPGDGPSSATPTSTRRVAARARPEQVEVPDRLRTGAPPDGGGGRGDHLGPPGAFRAPLRDGRLPALRA